MRLRAAALPPVVLAVVLMAPGGCGSSSKSDTSKFSGTEKDVAQAVYDMRDAVAKRDEGKLCDTYLTASLKDQLAASAKADKRGSSCADQLKDSLQDVDSTDITVESVKVSGTSATVIYKTNVQHGTDPTNTLTLSDEGHSWRIAQLP